MGEGNDFGFALDLMKKENCKMARKGWNGKNMYIELFAPKEKPMSKRLYKESPYIRMKTADNTLVPWLASQTDLLAEDWVIA
jgi:hypothetical protein